VEILEPRSSPHYARRTCPKCKKFLGWVPKPETLERRKENTIILTQLSKITLPAWERRFVRELASHANISPKQQKQLYLLRDMYLGKEDSSVDRFNGKTMP
jgi:hypothetical protein